MALVALALFYDKLACAFAAARHGNAVRSLNFKQGFHGGGSVLFVHFFISKIAGIALFIITSLGHKLNGVAFTVYASGTFDKNNYIFSHNIILKLILPCCKLLRVKAGNIAKLLAKKFFAQLCKALYFIGNKKLHFAALPG